MSHSESQSVTPLQTETLEASIDEQVCTITLDRPEAMNALDGEMIDYLWHAFRAMRHDHSVRAVVVRGAGDRAFCAGADLEERQSMTREETLERIDDYRGCFGAIASLPKPVVCAIDGYAFGGGLELALACDLRVVDAETKVGLTETSLGIIPGAGGTQRLPRVVGAAKAKELIFSAAQISGTEAERIGLASYAVSSGKVVERAHELAAATTSSAPIAVGQAKRAIEAGMQTDLQTGLEIEAQAYRGTLSTEDREEGLAAFREDREPKFEGR